MSVSLSGGLAHRDNFARHGRPCAPAVPAAAAACDGNISKYKEKKQKKIAGAIQRKRGKEGALHLDFVALCCI